MLFLPPSLRCPQLSFLFHSLSSSRPWLLSHPLLSPLQSRFILTTPLKWLKLQMIQFSKSLDTFQSLSDLAFLQLLILSPLETLCFLWLPDPTPLLLLFSFHCSFLASPAGFSLPAYPLNVDIFLVIFLALYTLWVITSTPTPCSFHPCVKYAKSNFLLRPLS